MLNSALFPGVNLSEYNNGTKLTAFLVKQDKKMKDK